MKYDKRKLRGLMMVKTDRGTVDHPNEDKIFKYLDSISQQMVERIKVLEHKEEMSKHGQHEVCFREFDRLNRKSDQSRQKMDKLQAFKEYVHKRLDDAGIEKEPNGEHSKHGCRIGDRLDIVLQNKEG